MQSITAVQWLENQLNENSKLTPVDFYQAKQIEKKQILSAWINAWKESFINPLEDKYYEQDAEQYYNKTYTK